MDIDVANLSQSTASGAGYAESRPGTLTGDGSLLTPVREHIRGRCLDLGATSEAWTQELESLATEVVTAAEFADASIHGPFDTVVGACQPAALAGMATTARQALGDDGLVVLGIDGWAQHLRTETQSATRALAALPRGNAWYIRRTLRRVGFKELTLYGVFPSIAEPKFIYPLADDTAVEWFIENRLTGWMDVAARVAHTAGMFEEGQPGYLAVCDGATDGTGPESAVTRVSYNRVVTFEFDGRHLARVRKAPRPSAGDATIRREQRVLDDLLNESTRAAVPTAVTSALPVGSLTASPTGAVRVESPVGGKPIGTWLDTDPVAVRNVLDTAFEWLASFQIAYRGRRVVREPDELRHRSRCPVLGVRDPPAYNRSVVSFVAPCHGDFHPWNVYADATGVTAVIDWEYATRWGDPAVDPAHFLLYVCAQVGETFEKGFDKLCASETPYSEAVRGALNRYCERVGVSRQTIVAALPYAHVHTVQTLRELGQPPAYQALCRTYKPRLTTITAQFENAVETLGEDA